MPQMDFDHVDATADPARRSYCGGQTGVLRSLAS